LAEFVRNDAARTPPSPETEGASVHVNKEGILRNLLAQQPKHAPDSISAMFGALLPSSAAVREWAFKRARQLSALLESSGVAHPSEEQLAGDLEALVHLMREMLEKGRDETMVPNLANWILSLADPDSFLQSGENTEGLPLWVLCVRNIIKIFAENDTLTGFFGKEHAVEEHLYRGRSRVFNDGFVENLINHQGLTLLPFPSTSSYAVGARFAKTLADAGQRVFGRFPHVDAQPTPSPTLFYLDMFRSAEEIHRINDYFSAYEREKRSNRALFHIHRDIADYPEILSLHREATVFCGNPGCNTNLKGISRAVSFCPGCGHAILNFCGNSDCHAVNVAEMIDAERAIQRAAELGDGIPHKCPSCNGELKNYWWKCPYHKEANPIDKVSCKKCLEEYHGGLRRLEEITSRPDHRNQVCHGCENLEENAKHCVQVPPMLVNFYHNGVNGHESRTFLNQLAKCNLGNLPHKLGEYLCTNSSSEHFLFPTCPRERGNKVHQHHLYKSASGRFCCTRHPEIAFHTCYNCGYPVERGADSQNCPRCMNFLMHCLFCSDRYGYLYPPLEGKGPARCPHCTNLMDLAFDPSLHAVEDDLTSPGFCPNIYCCEAGAHAWDTACECVDEPCLVCTEPAARRMPRNILFDTVKSCPLCLLVLSPVPDGLRQVPIGPREIDDRLATFARATRPCRICGIQPKTIVSWMLRDGFVTGESDAPERWPQREPVSGVLPQLGFDDALAILRALRLERAASSAYQRVGGKLQDLAHEADPLELIETLLNIFPAASKLQKALHIRLQGLLDEYERHLAQLRHWHQPGEKKSRGVL